MLSYLQKNENEIKISNLEHGSRGKERAIISNKIIKLFNVFQKMYNGCIKKMRSFAL